MSITSHPTVRAAFKVDSRDWLTDLLRSSQPHVLSDAKPDPIASNATLLTQCYSSTTHFTHSRLAYPRPRGHPSDAPVYEALRRVLGDHVEKTFEPATIHNEADAALSAPSPRLVFRGTNLSFSIAFDDHVVNPVLQALNRLASGGFFGEEGTHLQFAKYAEVIGDNGESLDVSSPNVFSFSPVLT